MSWCRTTAIHRAPILTVLWAYWFNGPMEVYYIPGHIPARMLHQEVWSYADGWDALVPASALQYPAFASPFFPDMVLASSDHVAMCGVSQTEDDDPIRISRFIPLGADGCGYSQLLRSPGLVLDPPALSGLGWDLKLSSEAGTLPLSVPFPHLYIPVYIHCSC